MKNEKFHEPVMVTEVFEYLHIKKNSKVIDATLGLAGHTIELIKKGAQVLGIEADRESLNIAVEKLKLACPGEYNLIPTPFRLVNSNFREIDNIAKENGFVPVDGILADLGVSTYQLKSHRRGLSFQNPMSFLDMRIDKVETKVTASDLLNLLRTDQLRDMFTATMSFPRANNLAKGIERQRNLGKRIKLVGDLLSLLPKAKVGKLNSATLPFLALRMAVNSEIPNLIEFLPKAFSILKTGGSLVVISFHSGEDKVVKNYFKNIEDMQKGKVLTQLPIVPSIFEVKRNPRARSAKMRVLMKS